MVQQFESKRNVPVVHVDGSALPDCVDAAAIALTVDTGHVAQFSRSPRDQGSPQPDLRRFFAARVSSSRRQNQASNLHATGIVVERVQNCVPGLSAPHSRPGFSLTPSNIFVSTGAEPTRRDAALFVRSRAIHLCVTRRKRSTHLLTRLQQKHPGGYFRTPYFFHINA